MLQNYWTGPYVADAPIAVSYPAIDESDQRADTAANGEQQAGDREPGRTALEHLHDDQDETNETAQAADAGQNLPDCFHAKTPISGSAHGEPNLGVRREWNDI